MVGKKLKLVLPAGEHDCPDRLAARLRVRRGAPLRLEQVHCRGKLLGGAAT
jgi:hypothetical protein